MTFDFTQQYPIVGVLLFLGCGLLVLFTDVRHYKRLGMTKEKRAGQVIVWVNMISGALLMVMLWAYNQFVW